MKVFVTSDLHFGHTNMIKYENRPFRDADEMDKYLIKQWNNTVSENDQVYILGDFTLKGVDYAVTILKQLKGTKILILGNHDNFANKANFPKDIFKEIAYYKEIKYKDKNFVLCHYPIADWDGKEHGVIHLYGHIHTIDNDAQNYMLSQFAKDYNCFNVGWDVEHRLFNIEEFITNE